MRGTLASLARYDNGYPFKPSDLGDSGTPVIRIKQLIDRTADMDRFTGNLPGRFEINDGDLVFSWSGSLAVRTWDRGRALLNQHLFRVVPVEGVVQDWLSYILTASLPRLAGYMHGSAMTHITKSMLKLVDWPVPDQGEQRRIADFLDDRVSRIDRIIDARHEQQVMVAGFQTAQREAILLGGGKPSAEKVADPIFGDVPVGWRATRLRRLNGFVQTGPFGSQLHSEEYVDDGWPVVNPVSITPRGLVALPGTTVDTVTRERLSRHVLRHGDIVFGRRGELGRAALVTLDEVGWVCGTGSLLLRANDERLVNEYLAMLLGTSRLRHFFLSQSVGSTMDNLNTGILLNAPILLPSPAVQRELVNQVENLDQETFEAAGDLTRSIDLMTEYKMSLITAALTGELDVTTAGSNIPG